MKTNQASEPRKYLIERKTPSNVRAFVEMFPDGTCGFHWDFSDTTSNHMFPGPEEKFEGVVAPENLREEIKNRNWASPMSSELRRFTDELWDNFHAQKINQNIPR